MKTQLLSMRIVLWYGFLLWLVPFVSSVIVFPVKASSPPFFETIMAVVVTTCAVALSIIAFRRVTNDSMMQGIRMGVIWCAVSILMDAPLFLFGGPLQMTFANYMMDIGLTYLIYPVITIGIGSLLQMRQNEAMTNVTPKSGHL